MIENINWNQSEKKSEDIEVPLHIENINWNQSKKKSEDIEVPLHADINCNIEYARETWMKLRDHNVKHIKIDWDENSHYGDANIVWVCTDVKDRRAIGVNANQSHASFKQAFLEAGNQISRSPQLH